LYYKDGNSRRYYCSGTLIDSQHVLTGEKNWKVLDFVRKVEDNLELSKIGLGDQWIFEEKRKNLNKNLKIHRKFWNLPVN
jgi:hypothetical protein